MVEPTGYTALDLIGFTDRGNYDPSAYYVKNDLVHDDNSSIWRVLIDDTHGVTPAEGLNYTIFIRNQADAAKQIIAPVETNPATDSHVAGTQLIYQDVLYNVTDDIDPTDALIVAPNTGYNIEAAPLVTSQIQALTNEVDSIIQESVFTIEEEDGVLYLDWHGAAGECPYSTQLIGTNYELIFTYETT